MLTAFGCFLGPQLFHRMHILLIKQSSKESTLYLIDPPRSDLLDQTGIVFLSANNSVVVAHAGSALIIVIVGIINFLDRAIVSFFLCRLSSY